MTHIAHAVCTILGVGLAGLFFLGWSWIVGCVIECVMKEWAP